MLWKSWVGPLNAEGIKMFRAPKVLDGSGSDQWLPHRVEWRDLKVGDLVIALLTKTLAADTEVMFVLQFWRVLEVADEGESVHVEINNIVGAAADGEYVYDRIAGLVGAPPSVRE
jgi:hypothetical protein